MGLFNLLKKSDINEGFEEYRSTAGALLVDVREKDEYEEGHLPGAVNIPLTTLPQNASVAGKKNTPLFIYCYGGGRAEKAAGVFESLGYTDLHSIGGIRSWNGTIER